MAKRLSQLVEIQINRNGIPINKQMSLALLQVMGVDDPFEGRRYDPQFEVLEYEKREAV